MSSTSVARAEAACLEPRRLVGGAPVEVLPGLAPAPCNPLTADGGDYLQFDPSAGVINRHNWESLPRRVARTTGRLRDIFGEAGVTGTFFMPGWVAGRHPEVVRRIVAEGHELASHGSDHYRADQQGRDEFRTDV